MKSPIKYLAPFTGSLQWIFDYLGGGEFLPSEKSDSIFLSKIVAKLLYFPLRSFPVQNVLIINHPIYVVYSGALGKGWIMIY